MNLRSFVSLLILGLSSSIAAAMATAQTTPAPATPAAQAKHQPPKPAATAAAGGGPDKVWVNTGTSVYHCPGDRYYGKTKDGRYMTEKDARAAGAKGPRGKTCFK